MFESARLKIERARKHIHDLARSVQEFVNKEPFKLRLDSRYGCFLSVTLDEPIPNDVMLSAGDAAHNLRSALDHCMWEIVVDADQFFETHEQLRQIQFPTADDQRKYENKIAKMPGLADDLASFLRNLAAFPGGVGYELFCVHNLDVDDKHKALVGTVLECEVHDLLLKSLDGTPANPINIPQVIRGDYSHGKTLGTIFGHHYGVFNIVQELRGPNRPSFEPNPKRRIEPRIYFEESIFTPPIPVECTLRRLSNSVCRTVDQFEALITARS